MMKKFHLRFLLFLVLIGGLSSAFAELDTTRYIPVSEITTDMDAYCLTVLEGIEIEKFPLKILSIVHNEEPGRDRILVIGTDERFKHVGSVHGCSGSPVYIDGRMAGALSAGWDGSIDPLYLVTPIEDMLRIREVQQQDNTRPIQFEADYLMEPEKFAKRFYQRLEQSRSLSKTTVPLIFSTPEIPGFDTYGTLKKMGLFPVFSSGFMEAGSASLGADQDQIAPGGVLASPICMGDINLAAVGTATEVVGNRVYAFGHSFMGTGSIELPMSAGWVHTVVAGRDTSFKFATAGPVLGTLRRDQASGVMGLIDGGPRMIPVTLHLERTDMPQSRDFKYRIAVDETLTAPVFQLALLSAANLYSEAPLENSLRYSVKIRVKNHSPIEFSNVTTGTGFIPPATEIFSVVGLLMTNPFEKVDIESVNISLRLEAKSREAEFWQVQLSDTTVKPGDTMEASVTLLTYRQEKATCTIPIKIPNDLAPDTYTVTLMSHNDYLSHIRKTSLHRFSPEDVESMIGMINELLNYQRNRLVAVLSLPPGGMALRQEELPDLPASRMALLQDPRRFLPISPIQHWLEFPQTLPLVPRGNLTIDLTVEQP